MNSPAQPLLFRREAVDYLGGHLYGQVLLAQPLSYSVLTAFFLVLSLIVAVFLFSFSYTSKATVQGLIVPSRGALRVVPPQAGIVSTRLVGEGSLVKRGDVLFVLSNERSTLDMPAQEQAVARLLQARRSSFLREREQQQAQDGQRLLALQRRESELASALRHVEAQISLQQERARLAEQAYRRNLDLQASSFISRAGVQTSEAEWLDQRQRLGDLQRTRSETARDLDAARFEQKDVLSQSRRNTEALAREITELDQQLAENAAKREITVRAGQAGRVTGITAQPGQMVTSTQSIATILSGGSTLEAELYAPSRTVGFIKVGMPVLLRYQAYPYQKFGQSSGRVLEVTASVLAQGDLPPVAASAGGKEPVYRIRVQIDQQSVRAYGREQPLLPGMALEASVLLEKRRLHEWILDPLFSVTGRV